ncbi:MAG: thermonuclease family protein [Candidatus Paceibacteria bacterium]
MDINLIINFLTAIISLFVPWFTFPSSPVDVPAETMAEVVSVIDGDTIEVNVDGKKETVRYIGIDTPEPRREGKPECGSHEATKYNRELVAGKTVRLVADAEDRDQYDRLLRYVYVGEGTAEVFVNDAIIAAGLARPLIIPPNDMFASSFKEAARAAAASNVGNWALCPD